MDDTEKVKLAREMFPIAASGKHFNYASNGACSARFVEQLNFYLRKNLTDGRSTPARYRESSKADEELRRELGQLLRTDSDHLVMTYSTSDGFRRLLTQIDLRNGDEIIATDLEHESVSIPLQRVANTMGATVRIVPVPTLEYEQAQWIERHTTKNTRLIVMSAVSFRDGRRMPFEAVAEWAAQRGIEVFVDAAQCAGTAPLNLGESAVSYCALPMQKWLFGPQGLGALYVADTNSSILHQQIPFDWAQLAATADTLRWLRLDMQWHWILHRIRNLTEIAHRYATRLDHWHHSTLRQQSGILTIWSDPKRASRTASELEHDGYYVRHFPETGALRISIPFFAKESELHGLFMRISAVD